MKLTVLVLSFISALAFSTETLAAGNSGSTGKPMNTTPTSRETSTSMDDHSDSALGRSDIESYESSSKKQTPRTSRNSEDGNGLPAVGTGADGFSDSTQE